MNAKNKKNLEDWTTKMHFFVDRYAEDVQDDEACLDDETFDGMDFDEYVLDVGMYAKALHLDLEVSGDLISMDFKRYNRTFEQLLVMTDRGQLKVENLQGEQMTIFDFLGNEDGTVGMRVEKTSVLDQQLRDREASK
jgi:hypothetical protein